MYIVVVAVRVLYTLSCLYCVLLHGFKKKEEEKKRNRNIQFKALL